MNGLGLISGSRIYMGLICYSKLFYESYRLTTGLETEEGNEEDRKLGRGTIFQYLGSSSTLAAGALFYIFMVKTIPQNAVGAVTLFQSVLGLFVTIFGLGLSYAGQHFISYFIARGEKDSARLTIRTIGTMLLFLAAMTAISIFLFSDYLGRFFYHVNDPQELTAFLNLVRILFPIGALFLANNLMNGMLLGMQRFRESGISTMTGAVMNYGFPFTLLLLYLYGGDFSSAISGLALHLNGNLNNSVSVPSAVVIMGWMIGYSITTSVYVFFVTRGIRAVFSEKKTKSRIDPALVKRMLKFSLPMFLSAIVTFGALYVDRLAVAFFLSPSKLAIYSLGLYIATSVAFFINPINSILLPKISQYFALKDENTIRKGVGITTTVVSFIYVPIALFIVSISNGVILVTGKPSYVGAALPFSIILGTSAIFITQNVLTQALAGIGATKTFIVSSTLSLTSNLVLSIILIPRYSLIGAAIAYSSVYVVSFTVLYSFAKKFNISEHRIPRIARIWVSAIVMYIIVYMFGNRIFQLPFIVAPGLMSFLVHDVLRLVVYMFLGLFVYVGMIRLTGNIASGDIEFFFRFMPKWLHFSKKYLLILFSGKRDMSGSK